MSWTHLHDSLLLRFVDGRLDDQEAVEVARHLDDCPACAARATAAEPLAQAFASVDDPDLPQDLVTTIVATARQRPAVAFPREPAVAAGLAAVAGLVFLGLGAPTELAATLGLLGDALGTVLRTVDLPLAIVTPFWAAAAMFTFAVAGMTARRFELQAAPVRAGPRG